MYESIHFSRPFLVICILIKSVLGQEEGSLPSSAAAVQPYVLGPEDQITVHVLNVDDIQSKPIQIDPNGDVDLPLVGRMRLAGKSVPETQQAIVQLLREFVREPKVTVNVVEYRSQPVSVFGEVNKPGIHPLQGPKTIVEVLSIAGGLRPESGSKVRISRRQEEGPLPLANARIDLASRSSVADVELEELLRGDHPAARMLVRAHDVISVPKAEMIYVLGEVYRAGGFTLGVRERVSVTQAIALAQGLQRTAAPKRATILRNGTDTTGRVALSIDVQSILEGRHPDQLLKPNDILYVPNNAARAVALRTVEAVIQAGTGIAIWRR